MSKWKIAFSVIGFFVVAVIAYAGYQFFEVKNTLSQITEDGVIDTPDKEIDVEPFTLLLLGIDQSEGDKGRSDTIILLSINPETQTTKMLSIPRDTRTEIIGRNSIEKINHSYAYGGVKMTVDTIENFIGVEVDYYATVNMESFSKIIDTVGGITVQNDLDMVVGNYTFNKGPVTLNGDDALVFSRIRYEDPRGDFGRQTRQRLIIEALMAKAKNPSILLNINEVLDIAGDSIKTNLTQSDIMQFPALYSKIGSSIDQLQFTKGEGAMIDGLWYYVMDDGEVAEISKSLNDNLKGISTSPSISSSEE
jgi:polyisoprenyl-teichoic acid--peptidoglycan teichoic acid transferase